MVALVAGQLPGHGGHGAERHERHRRIRPPYNHNSGTVQHFLFLHPQRWLGVSHPIDTAQDYVIGPLETIPGNPALTRAIAEYKAAPEKTKKEWGEAYAKPLKNMKRRKKKNTPPEHRHRRRRAGAVTVSTTGADRSR